MLKNVPQLYYSDRELLEKFERGLKHSIEDRVPIRLMFMVDDFVHYVADATSNPMDKMKCVMITYVPVRFVNKYREKELYYVAEGSEHIFLNIGKD